MLEDVETIYQWWGAKSTLATRAKGKEIATKLAAELVSGDSIPTLVVVRQGEESAEFWDAMRKGRNNLLKWEGEGGGSGGW